MVQFNLLLTFLWSFLIALFAIPSIISVSRNKKLLDEPNDRKVHQNLTPRLGGVAIFAGFMSAITIFGNLDEGVQQLLAGCLIIFFVGVQDDIISLSALKKFFVQVLASGIVIFIADIRITSFQGLFGIEEIHPTLSYVFTLIVIIGITNAINLIDGLDGLAGSIVLLASLTFAMYFYIYDHNSPYAYVGLSLAGGVVGFLRFNLKNASIFMGDTGSLVCGFILSILSIKFIENDVSEVAPIMSMAILIVPLFDTLRAFSLRIIRGRSPFNPDKNHIHHRLLSFGFSQISVVISLVILNIAAIITVENFSYLGNTNLSILALILIITFSIILRTLKRKDAEELS